MGYILVIVACAAVVKEAARLYAELQRSTAIAKADADDWKRWHWQPTAEQQARLDAEVAESKQAIAAYNRRYWEKWKLEHQL
jgi:hypothetical protein